MPQTDTLSKAREINFYLNHSLLMKRFVDSSLTIPSRGPHLTESGFLRTYFSKINRETFKEQISELLNPIDTKFEALLWNYAMETVAETVKYKRLKHASMTVDSLRLKF
jgi:hypothetical protein